jgi:hypothetical protein
MRMISVKGHAAYIGRHFMDCVVRVNVQAYAVCRVPVTRNLQHVPSIPPRAPHTELKNMLRRRR